MKIEKRVENGVPIALVEGEEKALTSPQEALDLAMTVKYETGSLRIALPKRLVAEEFFILSSGLAGEVLQKCVNYHFKLAIWGDFSHYTSKPLHDFIYESNQGNDFFFVASQEEALRKLAEAE